MNAIFLTGQAPGATDRAWDQEELMKKIREILKDERVRKSLQIISFVAPLAAGPMASATGRVLPTVAKGLKHAPHAINCVITLTQS